MVMEYKVYLEGKAHDKILSYEEAMKLKETLERIFSNVKVEVKEIE